MTRKDYIQTASILNEQLGSLEDGEILKDAAEAFADMFARDNARFDRERFLKACGLND